MCMLANFDRLNHLTSPGKNVVTPWWLSHLCPRNSFSCLISGTTDSFFISYTESLFCVCVHVHVCMCSCVCACMHMFGGLWRLRSMLGVTFSWFPLICWGREGFLLVITGHTRLAGQQVSRSACLPFPWCWGPRCALLCLTFLYQCWGSNSGFHGWVAVLY